MEDLGSFSIRLNILSHDVRSTRILIIVKHAQWVCISEHADANKDYSNLAKVLHTQASAPARSSLPPTTTDGL